MTAQAQLEADLKALPLVADNIRFGSLDGFDQAGGLAPSEGHHRELARLRLRSSLFHGPAVVEKEVKRGIERNFEYPEWSHLRQILKI